MQALLEDAHLAQLRQALAEYTVDGVHELVGLAGQLALARGEVAALARGLDDSRLADLTRLFLLGESIPAPRAARAVRPLGLGPAITSGLLRSIGDSVAAGFDLRPYAQDDGPSWWVISDFGSDVRPGPVARDHVLGIGAASLSLAQSTVREPVERALDLGTGCGIQALHLSGHARSVVGTDVSVRALRLAQTNAKLNGLDWDLRAGSLLEPVAAEQFDLIVANPPFVISSGAIGHEYRDGGLAGDELCRRLVGELPAHLRPGGTAQLLGNWAVTAEQTWEERVTGWLADSGASAWIWQREVVPASDYVALWLRDSGDLPGSPTWMPRYDSWLRWLEQAGIVGVGMGLINIRALPGPVVCEDVPQAIDQPSGATIEHWFDRQQWLRTHDDQAMLAARLELAPDVTLVTEAVTSPDQGGWQILERRLRQGGGLRWEIETDELMAGLLAALDGHLPLDVPVQMLAVVLDVPSARCVGAVLPVIRDLLARGLLTPARAVH